MWRTFSYNSGINLSALNAAIQAVRCVAYGITGADVTPYGGSGDIMSTAYSTSAWAIYIDKTVAGTPLPEIVLRAPLANSLGYKYLKIKHNQTTGAGGRLQLQVLIDSNGTTEVFGLFTSTIDWTWYLGTAASAYTTSISIGASDKYALLATHNASISPNFYQTANTGIYTALVETAPELWQTAEPLVYPPVAFLYNALSCTLPNARHAKTFAALTVLNNLTGTLPLGPVGLITNISTKSVLLNDTRIHRNSTIDPWTVGKLSDAGLYLASLDGTLASYDTVTGDDSKVYILVQHGGASATSFLAVPKG